MPMKLTAEQYSACWKERVAKEEAAQEAALTGSIKQRGQLRPSSVQSDTRDDDLRSVCSRASDASSYHSEISSRVSSSSSSARKIELLQKQLQEETDRRLKLEMELKKGPQPINTS